MYRLEQHSIFIDGDFMLPDLDAAAFDEQAVLFYDQGPDGEDSRQMFFQICSHPQSALAFHALFADLETYQGKYLCASLIANNIQNQWETFSETQKENFKEFYFWIIFECEEQQVCQQLITILIYILFEEWPQNWPTFLQDLITEAKTKLENTTRAIELLKRLSIEVRTTQIHSSRKKELVTAIHKYLQLIFTFLQVTYESCDDFDIMEISIECLAEYLGWIDLRLINARSIIDLLLEGMMPVEEHRKAALMCISAILSQESLTADPLLHVLLENFLDVVSSDLSMLTDEDLIPEFVTVLTRFVCLDRCSLMPNDTLIQWMIEYTRFVTDEPFAEIVDMWFYLAKTCMIDGQTLPFSPQYLVPLQVVLCQQMPTPEEFGGEPDLYEKMGDTLAFLFQIRHEQILDMLVESVTVEHYDESVIPLFYAVGAIAGICSSDEEESMMSSAIESIMNWIDNDEETEFSVAMYLFLVSQNTRYLYNHDELNEITIERIIDCLRSDSDELMYVAVGAFRRLAKSPRLFAETGFAIRVLESVEDIVRIIPTDLHFKFYEGLTILAKSCSDEEMKHSIIVTLFGNCSSVELLAQLVPIVDECLLESIEDFIGPMIERIDEEEDRHPLYVLFESLLESFPMTRLRDMLVDLFMTHSEDYESLDCLAVLIKQGELDLIPAICGDIIEPIFEVISSDFTEEPEVRWSFFGLVKVILSNPAALDDETFSHLFRFIFYGLSHPQYDISEMSLNCITGILSSVDSCEDPGFVSEFYETFYWNVLHELLNVLFDGIHKPLFSLLTQALHYMLHLVSSAKVEISKEEIQESIFEKLVELFPHNNQDDLMMVACEIVDGATNCGKLRTVLSDFIITSERLAEDSLSSQIAEFNEQLNIPYVIAVPECFGVCSEDDLMEI